MHSPQPASLEPLPEDVPEELPIQCNGRSALLAVRTQRVLYNDQEISASKFEALCGKGDAKKWKCSIWQEDDEGQPVMVSVPRTSAKFDLIASIRLNKARPIQSYTLQVEKMLPWNLKSDKPLTRPSLNTSLTCLYSLHLKLGRLFLTKA